MKIEALGTPFEARCGIDLFRQIDAIEALKLLEAGGARILGSDAFQFVDEAMMPFDQIDVSNVNDTKAAFEMVLEFLSTDYAPGTKFELVWNS